MESDWTVFRDSVRVGCIAFGLVLIDVLVYGTFIPIIAVWTGGVISSCLNLNGMNEVVVVLILTFCFFYGIFFCDFEESYWNTLFRLEKTSWIILQIRDFINLFMLVLSIKELVLCHLRMSSQPSIFQIPLDPMNKPKLHHGIEFIILHYVTFSLGMNFHGSEELLQSYMVISDTATNDSISKVAFDWCTWMLSFPCLLFGGSSCFKLDETIETRQTEYLIEWTKFTLLLAYIAGSVAKLIYFKTLFSYLRAMRLFMELHPILPSRAASIASENVVQEEVEEPVVSSSQDYTYADISDNSKSVGFERERIERGTTMSREFSNEVLQQSQNSTDDHRHMTVTDRHYYTITGQIQSPI